MSKLFRARAQSHCCCAYSGVFPVGCAEATDFTMKYSEQVAAFVKAEV